jgi:hypothetical protein
MLCFGRCVLDVLCFLWPTRAWPASLQNGGVSSCRPSAPPRMKLEAVLPQKYPIESLSDMRDHRLHRYGVAYVVRQFAVGIVDGFKFELFICLQGKTCDCSWLTSGEIWNYREAKAFVLVRAFSFFLLSPGSCLMTFSCSSRPARGALQCDDGRRYRSLSIRSVIMLST